MSMKPLTNRTPKSSRGFSRDFCPRKKYPSPSKKRIPDRSALAHRMCRDCDKIGQLCPHARNVGRWAERCAYESRKLLADFFPFRPGPPDDLIIAHHDLLRAEPKASQERQARVLNRAEPIVKSLSIGTTKSDPNPRPSNLICSYKVPWGSCIMYLFRRLCRAAKGAQEGGRAVVRPRARRCQRHGDPLFFAARPCCGAARR